ncbi:MAG: nucleotidyl transferase AbiEii/AbiGii toxin family protein [Bacteroidota bacterium]
MKQSTPAEKYTELYFLQDKVLSALSGHFGPFYLSGGAALSRYYLNHRFTLDLDLSVNLQRCFLRNATPVVDLLKTQFHVTADNAAVYPRYFHLWIQGRDKLKISLSNDISEQLGLPVMAGMVPVDNMKNMLVKKLKTILERDDPKDLFDIVGIASAYSFHWGDILRYAQRKAMMAQVNLLLQFSQVAFKFYSIRGKREPKDLFSLLGSPSPIGIDRVYLTACIERNGIISEIPSSTLESLSGELRRTAYRLKAISEQDDFADETAIHGIPSSFNLTLGGASIRIVLNAVSVREKALKQFSMVPAGLYQGMEWMSSPVGADELEAKFEQIRNDLFLAGENSLGRGKTPIGEARPEPGGKFYNA